MAQRRFEYTFDDESDRNRIAFDFADEDAERIRVSVESGEAVVYANHAGFMTLAKLCLKLAMGSYSPGFHIHLREDFSGDAALPDQLRLGLMGEDD